jgi:hypothetical protein
MPSLSSASSSRLKKAISLIESSLLSIHASFPPNSFVLGIDASVRCSGIALVDARTGVPSRVAISRTQVKAPPLFAGGRLAAAVRAVCSSRTHNNQAVRIIETSLEEIPMQFKASSSSSMTRFALARVNGVAAYECWKFSGGAPVQFHYPNAMRSYFGIKPHKMKGNALNKEGVDGSLISSTSSSKSNDNKKAVLEMILSLYPTLLAGIEEVETKSGSQGVADEFQRPMSWLEGDGSSSLLRFLTPKEANTTKFDVADATLAALYGLATHLTFRTAVCNNGQVFANVASEFYPKNSEMLLSIIEHHRSSCIIEESRERLQPVPEDLLQIEKKDDSLTTKMIKKKKKLSSTSIVEKQTETSQSPPSSSEDIERNYRKVRTLFDKACQSILVSGNVFPLWKQLGKPFPGNST